MAAKSGRPKSLPLASEDELVDATSEASMDASDPPAYSGVTGVGGPKDDVERQGKIRRRAYELWLQAGRPNDRDEELWLQAERETGGPSA